MWRSRLSARAARERAGVIFTSKAHEATAVACEVLEVVGKAARGDDDPAPCSSQGRRTRPGSTRLQLCRLTSRCLNGPQAPALEKTAALLGADPKLIPRAAHLCGVHGKQEPLDLIERRKGQLEDGRDGADTPEALSGAGRLSADGRGRPRRAAARGLPRQSRPRKKSMEQGRAAADGHRRGRGRLGHWPITNRRCGTAPLSLPSSSCGRQAKARARASTSRRALRAGQKGSTSSPLQVSFGVFRREWPKWPDVVPAAGPVAGARRSDVNYMHAMLHIVISQYALYTRSYYQGLSRHPPRPCSEDDIRPL